MERAQKRGKAPRAPPPHGNEPRERLTRSRHAANAAAQGVLNKTVLAQPDIIHLMLPQLDFASFVSMHGTCREIRAGMQAVIEDLIQILERASSLYVSPRFAEGLALVAEHHPYVCWMLQVCAAARSSRPPCLGSCPHTYRAFFSLSADSRAGHRRARQIR